MGCLLDGKTRTGSGLTVGKDLYFIIAGQPSLRAGIEVKFYIGIVIPVGGHHFIGDFDHRSVAGPA